MKRRSAVAVVATLAAAALIAAATVTSAGGAAGTTFTNFSLASTPPSPAGTLCPGSTLCWNNAAEPAIRATPDGSFWASSENGLGAGTIAWKSADKGLHYSSLLSPNDASVGSTSTGKEAGLEPGGGDTDVAVATARNAAGFYNVYVASLTLANVDVSTSQDGGATWSLNPVTALPIDDREWAAATGASTVCISYLTAPGILLPEAGLHVQCSNDAGTTFPQLADAYDTSDAATGCRSASRSGNLAFDPSNGSYLYAIAACQTVADATNPNPTDLHVIVVGVSSDGGHTFTDHVVYANPDATVGYANQFPNIAVDRGGNVYAVYSDDHFVYYSYSTDHGSTWNGPFTISKAGTSVFPWATAGDAGKLDVVYYSTPYFDANADPGTYPSSAAWTVRFAQNLKATTAGSAFTETTASPVVHYGAVCQGGVGCTGNRDLYDDFGVAASPTTGLASIVYSDDQYRNDAADPPAPGCTSARSNTGSCDHTAIATQTSGSGIFSTTKKK
jgi:hypothetical protein